MSKLRSPRRKGAFLFLAGIKHQQYGTRCPRYLCIAICKIWYHPRLLYVCIKTSSKKIIDQPTHTQEEYRGDSGYTWMMLSSDINWVVVVIGGGIFMPEI